MFAVIFSVIWKGVAHYQHGHSSKHWFCAQLLKGQLPVRALPTPEHILGQEEGKRI